MVFRDWSLFCNFGGVGVECWVVCVWGNVGCVCWWGGGLVWCIYYWCFGLKWWGFNVYCFRGLEDWDWSCVW